jgi:hypothetical protein
MTVIRNRPPQQVRPTAPRTETVDVAARTTEVADRFEAAVGRNGRGNEQLVAGNVVGVVTAFVMNGAAMLGGVSNSMTGLGAAPRRCAARNFSRPSWSCRSADCAGSDRGRDDCRPSAQRRRDT